MRLVQPNRLISILLMAMAFMFTVACSSDDEPQQGVKKYDISLLWNLDIEPGTVVTVTDNAAFDEIFKNTDAPKVDFNKYSLVLVCDRANYGIEKIDSNYSIDSNKLNITVRAQCNTTTVMQKWVVGYLIPRNSSFSINYKVDYIS